MKVSFDYDGTIEKASIQKIAKKHIDAGDDVWIVTRRYDSESKGPYDVADKLGIDRNHVRFTNGEWKYKTLGDLGIELHYDNKDTELQLIKANTKIKTLKV